MRYLLTVTFFVACAAANSTNPVELVFKAYKSCAEKDIISCFKKKTVLLIERAAKEDKLTIIKDSIQLIRDPSVNITYNQTERSLGDTIFNLFSTHRIQFKLPQLTFLHDISEGRGKKNKGYGAMAMMMGGGMLALGMAALAALAGKALAASMAALMMAALAATRKGGGGGGGGHHSSYEVISIPSHHHRSFYEQEHQRAPYQYDQPPMYE